MRKLWSDYCYDSVCDVAEEADTLDGDRVQPMGGARTDCNHSVVCGRRQTMWLLEREAKEDKYVTGKLDSEDWQRFTHPVQEVMTRGDA